MNREQAIDRIEAELKHERQAGVHQLYSISGEHGIEIEVTPADAGALRRKAEQLLDAEIVTTACNSLVQRFKRGEA